MWLVPTNMWKFADTKWTFPVSRVFKIIYSRKKMKKRLIVLQNQKIKYIFKIIVSNLCGLIKVELIR